MLSQEASAELASATGDELSLAKALYDADCTSHGSQCPWWLASPMRRLHVLRQIRAIHAEAIRIATRRRAA